jgi:hypothetical protein
MKHVGVSSVTSLCEVHQSQLTATYCSIHRGFSVVFKSSIISFFINASFFLRSDGVVMTLKLIRHTSYNGLFHKHIEKTLFTKIL